MNTVRIRPYTTGDEKALFEAARESIADVHPWLPWCHPGYTWDEAASWIALQRSNWQTGSEFQFAVTSSEGRFIGGCGINFINPEHNFANLGYWIRSSETGAGRAVEAVRLLKDWVFSKTELVRLELVVATANTRSARVAEKAGARLEGTLRNRLKVHGKVHDAYMFSFVPSNSDGPISES